MIAKPRMNRLLVCYYCVGILGVMVRGQLPVTTSTATEFRTVTQFITVKTEIICAKLVNVTGVCRTRRGFSLDEPVILTFDDDLNESVDAVLNHRQFAPTQTLSVEATPEVVLEDVTHSPHSPSDAVVIQPSSTARSARRRGSQDYETPAPRIYFAQINAFFNGLVSQILGQRSTVTITVTNVQTDTRIVTSRTTNSFFVLNCTPSPFPYQVCSQKRR